VQRGGCTPFIHTCMYNTHALQPPCANAIVVVDFSFIAQQVVLGINIYLVFLDQPTSLALSLSFSLSLAWLFPKITPGYILEEKDMSLQ
jgi:hypothetical protein